MSLKEVAVETLQLVKRGAYEDAAGRLVDFAVTQRRAVQGTELYTPERLHLLLGSKPERPLAGGAPTIVTCTDETTQVAARRLAAEHGDVVLLNFASARNHGGGFLNGAKAQEEDLCRCSGLFDTLLKGDVQAYFSANRREPSLLYTDHAIYSPRVPWFRVAGRGALLDHPFEASVITAPAPNAGPLLRQDPGALPAIVACFERRWGNVLALAEERGHRTVLLGAWGCGAFGNEPSVAASTASQWLTSARFHGAFDRVIFAIPRKGARGTRNHDVFAAQFG